MIKFGIRHNLCYPLILIILIALRRIVELLLKRIGDLGVFPLLLIFLSKSLAGLISKHYFNDQKKKGTNKNLNMALMKYIKFNKNNLQKDSSTKIIILLLLASYFDFVGSVVRKVSNFKENSDKNFRSSQILISAFLCKYALKAKIYKHNAFSLLIISIFSIIIIILEFVIQINKEDMKIDFLLSMLLSIFSGIARGYLDTIEKYLFEFDYLSPFKVLMIIGVINTCFTLFFFLIDSPIPTFENLNNNFNNDNKIVKIMCLVFLLILYFIISGLKNIYIVITIKIYSPMTRALTETILDPFFLLYDFIIAVIKEDNDWDFYIINIVELICLSIIVFFSCVYNDFIILYCYGLEYNTYKEIHKRALSSMIYNYEEEEEDIDEGYILEINNTHI